MLMFYAFVAYLCSPQNQGVPAARRLHFHQEGIPAHETTLSTIYPIRGCGGLVSLRRAQGCSAISSRALLLS
jgi:hypothetical protein